MESNPEKQMVEIPPEVEAEIKYKTVCFSCKEKNLVEDIHLIRCGKCQALMCGHFASSVDPQLCTECCSDVQMTDERIKKTETHFNKDLEREITTHQTAKRITLTGNDWLFYQRKISNISDDELGIAVEYHRAIYNSMLYEREKRRIEHFHRNEGKQVKFNTSAGTTVSSSTEVKRTKTVSVNKQTKAVTNLKVALEQMLKSGMTPEQIQAMLLKGK